MTQKADVARLKASKQAHSLVVRLYEHLLTHDLLKKEEFRPLYQSKLARDLHTWQSNIRRALDTLVKLGFLEHQGERYYHLYRLKEGK